MLSEQTKSNMCLVAGNDASILASGIPYGVRLIHRQRRKRYSSTKLGLLITAFLSVEIRICMNESMSVDTWKYAVLFIFLSILLRICRGKYDPQAFEYLRDWQFTVIRKWNDLFS